MKFIFAFCISFSLICQLVDAQTFQKSYGGPGIDYAQHVIALSNGGFAISGTKNDQMVLIRLDANGDTLWTKSYATSELLIGSWVKETGDNGFILIGHDEGNSSEGLSDFLAVRTDVNGNPIWSKSYGTESAREDICMAVAVASDGYYLAGYSYTASINENPILIKIDTEGEIIWAKDFGWNGDDVLNEVVTTSDGGCVAVGSTNSFVLGAHAVLVTKWSSDGEEQWSVIYYNEEDLYGYGINSAGDGFGYLLSGAADSNGDTDCHLIRITEDAGIIWSKKYGGSEDDNFSSTLLLESGEVIAAGQTASFGSNRDVLLLKTNPGGEVDWSKHYGGDLLDFVMSIVETSDGYLFVGGEESFAEDREIYVVKTDLDGNSNCNEADCVLTSDDFTLDAGSVAVNPSDNIYMEAAEVIVHEGLDAVVHCQTIEISEMSSLDDNVYPNPFRNSFTITGTSRDGKMMLTDLSGKIIVEMDTQEEVTFISANELPGGIYLLTYFNGTNVQNIQVSKD